MSPLARGDTFFMNNKICCFFGHWETQVTDELYNATKKEFIKAITFGCRTFLFGGFGRFDDLCYEIVTKIKNEEPELKLNRIYCVPLEKQLKKGSRFFNPADFEDVVYLEPSFSGWYKSIYFRNCAMIDASDYVIFYAENKEDSGAYKAYKYAVKKKDKIIVNLWGKQ